MNPLAEPYRCYRAKDHPEGKPRQWVYASALVRPLGICMLPVMIGALVAMLEGGPALGFLTRGAPIAMILASIWTWIRVRDTIVEVCVSPNAVAIFSLNDAAHPRSNPGWKRLFDFEEGDERITLTAGHEEFQLDPSRFPDVAHLVADCRAALFSRSG